MKSRSWSPVIAMATVLFIILMIAAIMSESPDLLIDTFDNFPLSMRLAPAGHVRCSEHLFKKYASEKCYRKPNIIIHCCKFP